MRSLTRVAVVVVIAVAGMAGVWAAPADDAGPTLVTAAADPTPPDVVLPDLGVSAAREAASSSTAAAQVAVPPTSSVPFPAEGDHYMSIEEPELIPEPIAVVTTTVAPATTAPPTPVATVAFHATQAYGSCGEDIPYDIFSGQATPGTTVSISSPHGSGSTTANANGQWERTVKFPSAPRGETFTITVSGLGGSQTFSFTATGGDHA